MTNVKGYLNVSIQKMYCYEEIIYKFKSTSSDWDVKHPTRQKHQRVQKYVDAMGERVAGGSELMTTCRSWRLGFYQRIFCMMTWV